MRRDERHERRSGTPFAELVGVGRREDGGLRASLHAEFGEDRGDVVLHRLLGEEELGEYMLGVKTMSPEEVKEVADCE